MTDIIWVAIINAAVVVLMRLWSRLEHKQSMVANQLDRDERQEDRLAIKRIEKKINGGHQEGC